MQTKYLGILTIAYVAFQLISDVTAGKLIAIGPFIVSVTILYFPITYIIADVLTEVYGYAAARKVVWVRLLHFSNRRTHLLVSLHHPTRTRLRNKRSIQTSARPSTKNSRRWLDRSVARRHHKRLRTCKNESTNKRKTPLGTNNRVNSRW